MAVHVAIQVGQFDCEVTRPFANNDYLSRASGTYSTRVTAGYFRRLHFQWVCHNSPRPQRNKRGRRWDRRRYCRGPSLSEGRLDLLPVLFSGVSHPAGV